MKADAQKKVQLAITLLSRWVPNRHTAETSLRFGGCFAYAPGLLFFEALLADDPRFQVRTALVLDKLS